MASDMILLISSNNFLSASWVLDRSESFVLSCLSAFKAAEASFQIFSVDSGSSAIFFSLASISVVRFLNLASSAAFLVFFSSNAAHGLLGRSSPLFQSWLGR
jgi:hypothetical protein